MPAQPPPLTDEKALLLREAIDGATMYEMMAGAEDGRKPG